MSILMRREKDNMLVTFQIILMVFMLLFGLFTLGDPSKDKDVKSIYGAITVISMGLLTVTFLVF